MEFLANENFPFPSVKLLRDAGYTVSCIVETNPGITDNQVIELAQSQGLIILTFDKDYGEIIYRTKTQNPPSVIFFRDKGQSPTSAGSKLLQILNSDEIEIEGRFTVIENNNFRQREY